MARFQEAGVDASPGTVDATTWLETPASMSLAGVASNLRRPGTDLAREALCGRASARIGPDAEVVMWSATDDAAAAAAFD